MTQFLIKFLSGIFLISLASLLAAHGENPPETSISASAQINLANKSAVESGQPWQIPGILMGGEALPMEQGIHVENLELQGVWYPQAEYSIQAKLSSHHQNQINVENFFIRTYPTSQVNLSVGKMDAGFSSTAGWHPYKDYFNEPPLTAEIMFGGHFTDTGFQGIYQDKQFTLGAEIWNGSAWPASSGEYSADLFLHHQLDFKHTAVKTGLWLLHANAKQRSDERYTSGHSHGVTISNTPTFYFSGSSTLAGVFMDLSWHFSNNRLLGIYSELIGQESEGSINDDTRIADIESQLFSYLSRIYFIHGSLEYAIRHEILSVDNTLTGAAANFVATDAGLVNNGFEPSRTHFSMGKQFNAFTIRSEAVFDKSYLEEGIKRFSISLLWQDNLWKNNSGS